MAEHNILLFSIIAGAGFLKALTGFGYALVAAPLLIFFMNPKDAVMLILMSGLLVEGLLVYRTRLQGNFTEILPMFFASILGALPGGYLLTIINDTWLKIIISITLLTVTYLLAKNYKVEFQNITKAKSITGFLSGFLGSTTSMSGPPIILFLLNKNDSDKNGIRANLCRYFLLGNSMTLIIAYFYGTFHVLNIASSVLLSFPAILLGVWLGEKMFKRLDPQAFRKIALAVIFCSSMAILISNVYKFSHTIF